MDQKANIDLPNKDGKWLCLIWLLSHSLTFLVLAYLV